MRSKKPQKPTKRTSKTVEEFVARGKAAQTAVDALLASRPRGRRTLPEDVVFVHWPVPSAMLREIDRYRFENFLRSRNEALEHIVQAGLDMIRKKSA